MAVARFSANPLPRRRAQLAVLIALGCTALYYLTRTPSLDEWDSVQFAMGVGEFNLWKHQPHPPGYPLYIAFGWLAERLLGLSVRNALSLGSALGGGLFVSGWFVLIVRRFPPQVAALSTVTLAVLADTWMSATKVLTDPLGTGLLTLALVLLDHPPSPAASPTPPSQTRFRLAVGALAAAAAVGVRPQNFGVLLLIVVLAILGETRHKRLGLREGWLLGLGSFLGGCLLWLVPVLAIQAHTPESGGDWLAYGGQLVSQWRWRFNQPKAFLGAVGARNEGMLLYRLDHHLLGWFTRGFGFSIKTASGWLGIAIILAGWAASLRASRRPPVERAFWRAHLLWALAYVLIIFCCLPGDQRYYLPIFPLFIVAAVAGWWTFLRGPWRWAAVAVPVAALAVTLPLVEPNHRDEAPPVQMLHWLQKQYPPDQRADVWLILRDTRRHAEWYAPEFHIVWAEQFLSDADALDVMEHARAAYTDDPEILGIWSSASHTALPYRLVDHYERSPLIYRKHSEVDLYKLVTN